MAKSKKSREDTFKMMEDMVKSGKNPMNILAPKINVGAFKKKKKLKGNT